MKDNGLTAIAEAYANSMNVEDVEAAYDNAARLMRLLGNVDTRQNLSDAINLQPEQLATALGYLAALVDHIAEAE